MLGNNGKNPLDDNGQADAMYALPGSKALGVRGSAPRRMASILGTYDCTNDIETRLTDMKSAIATLCAEEMTPDQYHDRAREILEKYPKDGPAYMAQKLGNIPENVREDIARLIIEQYPSGVSNIIGHGFRQLPESVRGSLAREILQKYPQKSRNLSWVIKLFPDNERVDIARLILHHSPTDGVDGFFDGFWHLPENTQIGIAHLILENPPIEKRILIATQLSEIAGKDIKIQNRVEQMMQALERSQLSEAESGVNPSLYKNAPEGEFLRQEMEKSGSRTILLGKTLVNHVILRIVSNQAFIAWVNTYRSQEAWTSAGFEYIPIEPIIGAHSSKDGKNVRVYSGVLGVTVKDYLNMYSNRQHHTHVRAQVQQIKKVLEDLGVSHGHPHESNFCILHERTPDGDIDWNKPPRVYCIDFNQATIKNN